MLIGIIFPYSPLPPSKVCSFYGRTLKDPGRRSDEFGKCVHKATSWLFITVKYMLYSPDIKGTSPILQPELICQQVNLLLIPVLSVPCDGGGDYMLGVHLYKPCSSSTSRNHSTCCRGVRLQLGGYIEYLKVCLKCCPQLGEAPSAHAPWMSLEVQVSLLESLSNANASPYKSLLLSS